MRYRRFGSTDLTVSEVGFGCARLGGVFQGASKSDLLRSLRLAFEGGVTFYDTADIYAQGESEALLGEAFRGRRRDVIVASKVGYCLPTQRRLAARIKPLLRPVVRLLRLRRQSLPGSVRGALAQDFSPPYLTSAVEGSLRRLRTDYLDVLQLHSPPPEVLERGEFLAPLETLKRAGKIRQYGVACERPEDVRLCLRYPQIASVQINLSLLHQGALDAAVPGCLEHGVAVIARQCYASGLLTRSASQLAAGPPPADEVQRRERDAVLRFHRIAAGTGRPLRETALQFVRDTAGVAVTLVGMRTPDQVADCLRDLAGAPLSEDERGRLRAPGARPAAAAPSAPAAPAAT
jgi:aryl-alcohol dehydrogenase-like predicted oxidoreductase